ncbi:hypothetical protein [Serratia fonticola]|uniref:hypothetical protein n=1 Tax=Serratia fonticola TaxID=47917 RepID=UPI000E0EB3B1|nr:hypothetical protein [Serratia fonticola]RDL15924.1 hypothetical protein DFO62_12219 [Serratia fonticola]
MCKSERNTKCEPIFTLIDNLRIDGAAAAAGFIDKIEECVSKLIHENDLLRTAGVCGYAEANGHVDAIYAFGDARMVVGGYADARVYARSFYKNRQIVGAILYGISLCKGGNKQSEGESTSVISLLEGSAPGFE